MKVEGEIPLHPGTLHHTFLSVRSSTVVLYCMIIPSPPRLSHLIFCQIILFCCCFIICLSLLFLLVFSQTAMPRHQPKNKARSLLFSQTAMRPHQQKNQGPRGNNELFTVGGRTVMATVINAYETESDFPSIVQGRPSLAFSPNQNLHDLPPHVSGVFAGDYIQR